MLFVEVQEIGRDLSMMKKVTCWRKDETKNEKFEKKIDNVYHKL